MCIQVPERGGRELLRLAPRLADQPNIGRAFLQSIVWRDVTAFSDDTLAVLNEVLRRATYGGDVYGTLLTVSMIPGHPFNAEFLDRQPTAARNAGSGRHSGHGILHYALQ